MVAVQTGGVEVAMDRVARVDGSEKSARRSNAMQPKKSAQPIGRWPCFSRYLILARLDSTASQMVFC